MLKLLLLDECYQKPYPDIWSLLYMNDSFFFYFFFFGIYFVILSRYEFHNVHGFKNCGEDNFRRIFCLIAYYFWFCAMIFFFVSFSKRSLAIHSYYVGLKWIQVWLHGSRLSQTTFCSLCFRKVWISRSMPCPGQSKSLMHLYVTIPITALKHWHRCFH